MTAIKAIVTDIEGTTSSIDFVHSVLFPYAAEALPEFLRLHQADPEVDRLLDDVRRDVGEPAADTHRLTDVLLKWIAEDRKATPLKALQGLIWKRGYESGAFSGHVYDDVPRNLRKWRSRGITLHVYSSGSVEAQKLLFGHSSQGDLAALFAGWFDTRVGGKRESGSYSKIATRIGQPPTALLFLSDVLEELDAASEAGLRTTQLVRHPGVKTGPHRVAHDFDDVLI